MWQQSHQVGSSSLCESQTTGLQPVRLRGKKILVVKWIKVEVQSVFLIHSSHREVNLKTTERGVRVKVFGTFLIPEGLLIGGH